MCYGCLTEAVFYEAMYRDSLKATGHPDDDASRVSFGAVIIKNPAMFQMMKLVVNLRPLIALQRDLKAGADFFHDLRSMQKSSGPTYH